MEIRIGKTSRACSACAREFEHEEDIHSIVRVEDRAFVRADYCAECWNPDHANAAHSVWSTRFYDPRVAEQEPPEVFSPLRQLFYECVEANERAELAKAYLAAQLLRRQKVFRLIKESDDADSDLRVALFADRIGNRLIEVRDPSLSLGEMEAGRTGLLERLREIESPEEEQEEESPSDDEEQPEV